MCSGTSPDNRLVEVIELPEHPYFVASQYHPEFKSRPNRPEPLFREFVGAALGPCARARAPLRRQGRSTESFSAWPSRPPSGCRRARGARSRPARQLVSLTGPVDGPAHDTGHGRVGDTFARLCEIPSPSGNEGAMAAAVRAELEAIGLAVTEDDTAAETGAGCGNLLARIPGPPGTRTVMLCAHIDTVPLTDRVEVELVDGVYRNRRDAILGADDKAGVAVMLEAARRWAGSGAPCGCELVFTTGEEVGLRGARAFDTDRARGRVRFRARPRRADRPHGGGRTDLLRRSCRVPGALRTRGHPAGGRAQRDRRGGEGGRGHAPRAGSTRRLRRTSE